MALLTTNFCNIKLKNPIIIASCPATETLEGVLKCAQAGAGAIILKSIADYNVLEFEHIPRRTYIDKKGIWATSSFSREVSPKDAGIELITRAKELVSIPIIASVAGLSFELNDWLPLCMEAQNAGADMIQLDLFYLEQPIAESTNFTNLIQVIDLISKELRVPIIPKLNVEIPAYLVAKHFPKTHIAGLSLLDSVRVNSPISLSEGGTHCYKNIQVPGMSSVVGQWELPLTQHYTFILAKHTIFDMCVGGGLHDALDAVEMLMLGATTVQYCTSILLNGYSYITKLVNDLEKLVEQAGYSSVMELRGKVLSNMYTDIQKPRTSFVSSYAEVDKSKCCNCQRCKNQAWCHAIEVQKDAAFINRAKCEGCSFCISLCKYKAIKLVSH